MMISQDIAQAAVCDERPGCVGKFLTVMIDLGRFRLDGRFRTTAIPLGCGQIAWLNAARWNHSSRLYTTGRRYSPWPDTTRRQYFPWPSPRLHPGRQPFCKQAFLRRYKLRSQKRIRPLTD